MLYLLTIRIDTNFEDGSNATRRSCLRDAFKAAEEFQMMHLSLIVSFCNQDVMNHLRGRETRALALKDFDVVRWNPELSLIIIG